MNSIKYFLAIGALVWGLTVAGFALPVLAQGASATCNCFCSHPDGVQEVGDQKDWTSCDTFCKNSNTRAVACATSFSQLPGNSLRCFTREQCIKQGGELDSVQAPLCPTGMSYCYPADTPINLMISIPIGEGDEKVGTVNNIGNYINTMYTFLLWAAFSFAVVMVMVGGLQYVLAAGSGNVAKAKSRMTSAVIGLSQ